MSKPPAPPAGSAAPAAKAPVSNFIRQIVDEDLRTNKWAGRVATRFPPEPNGYLHIGHAKSICLNFGLARDYGGVCHMRFDDTNPLKEEQEYVDSILESVRWLGFDWGAHLYYASDYFDRLYTFAEALIERDRAYVDQLSAEEMRSHRGTLTEPGRESPYRNRPPAESLALFRRMRAGEFPDGAMVLRAKIDMGSPNINLRDPVIYRIRHAEHHRTGAAWCIYPMYDYTHCLSDALEYITHSICTLEFEDHRPLYDWVIETLVDLLRADELARLEGAVRALLARLREGGPGPLARTAQALRERLGLVDSEPERARLEALYAADDARSHAPFVDAVQALPFLPNFRLFQSAYRQLNLSDEPGRLHEPAMWGLLPRQIEFARLNLTYTVMSKRKLIQLVEERHVDGWDDPRMNTIVGVRRRGYTPEAIRLFAERIGVSKADSWIEYTVLEDCLREDLNERALRRAAVLRPVKLIIDNYDATASELCRAPNHPLKPELGTRELPFSRELWIEADDYADDPPKGYFRLTPGAEVRLRYAYIVRCVGAQRDAAGNLVAVHCTYDPQTRSGTPGAEARKVKGNIHWLCARSAQAAEVRLYDRLFAVPTPGAERDFLLDLNPASKQVIPARVEPALAGAAPEERFQFERHGYFVADRADHRPDRPVFNRAVTLRDSWGKQGG